MPRMTIFRSNQMRARALALALPLVLALPVQAGAQGTPATSHTVRKGDTLWDLARTYLGDPFLWPQIYKVNTDVVKDPHWIYPGEVLRLEAGAGVKAVPDKDTPPPPAAATPPEAQPAPAAPAPGITVVGPSDQTEDEGMALFRRKRVVNLQNAFKTYREVKDHPLRSGEFFAAGFLTEGDTLPFGRLLGPVTPEQIESTRARTAVQIFTTVAVLPPAGAHYAVGDTLLVVDRREGPVGYGEIIAPTGLIRVTGQNGEQTVGDVISVFAPIRDGQSVLPAEKFADPGAVKYQAVSGGLEGHILVSRDVHELRHPQQVLFIDIGKSAGVTAGDLFEARRTSGPQAKAAADAVDEVMATLQVIHVRHRTATVKVMNVISPDVPIGTRVKQVAKLPS
jgi:hypothetical protein